MLDCLPRKHPLRRVHGSFDYHTPPSSRKGRVLLGEDAAELKHRLRHVRSNETNCSGATLRRGNSVRERSASAGSALGLREAEVREDMELGEFALGGESSFQVRLEELGRGSIGLGGRRVWRGGRGLGGWRRRRSGLGRFDTVSSSRFCFFGPRLRLAIWRRDLFLLLDSFSCSWVLPPALDVTCY